MKPLRLLSLASCFAALFVHAACGDDEDVTVRSRLDAGEGGVGDGGEEGGSSCGIALPGTYESPTFETNAAQELGLRNAFDAFLAPMKTVETQAADGGTPTPITKAQLEVLYAAGTPSVKATSTSYYQTKVAEWLTAYGTAITDGTYSADQPDGGDKGGTLGGFVFDPNGIDLRQAIEQGTSAAAFYNQAVSLLTNGSITVGTVDRLVAAYGAHPSFPNNPNAPQNKDVNAAANAARRDSKEASNPGPYQRIRAAAIKAKATVEAGDKCKADRDAALKTFLNEWERSSYATVIYDFDDIIARLSSSTSDTAAVLHALGGGIGLIAGFKTIPQPQRIITDAQIDSLLQKALAPEGAPAEGYKLKTNPVEAVNRLNQAITEIKGIYAFSDAQMEAFKKNN